MQNHPLVSVSTGEVIAHINIEIKLALPISELYQLFLQRHPTEKSYIEDISNKRVLQSAIDSGTNTGGTRKSGHDVITQNSVEDEEDASRLYNELEITIHQAYNLPNNSDGTAPTTYAVFQFLGSTPYYLSTILYYTTTIVISLYVLVYYDIFTLY